MNWLLGLIHEMHRRSLWQVLGVFLAASWGVVEFVEFLTERAGLPDWTPSMALALLLIGLPIVLATAFVQEGLPGGEEEGEGGREMDSGSPQARGVANGDPAPDGPFPRPTNVQRIFTWRKALLGGAAALGLLALAVAAYLVMWATGIGPVGNLVAQGVIAEGDRVVLATFHDETGEGLGDVVSGALRVDLAQASILNLVEEVDVAPVLTRMQVDPGTVLTSPLAREVALREGFPAIIDGEVARAGSGYVITANLREAESGRSLASFRVSAQGPDEVIGAMDRLSREIREKSGESLRLVRAGEPLEQVTTRSLDALRLFTEADRAFTQGDYREALGLLEQAVVVDPAFAMAWRRMAATLNNIGTDPARHEEAASQAYLHRDRLTERERFLAEAYYFGQVERDRARTISAYQSVLRIAPHDRAALNNLGNEYIAIEDYPRGLELYRQAVDGPGRTNTAFQNLIRTHIAMGDVSGAAAALEEFASAYPEEQGLPEWRFWVAFVQDDLHAARDALLPLINDPAQPAFVRSNALGNRGITYYREGRLDEGRTDMLAAQRVAAEVGPAFELFQRQWTVHFEQLLGDPAWALRHLEDELQDGFFALEPEARSWWFVAVNLARSGDRAATEAVLEAWETHLVENRGPRMDGIDIQRARLLLDMTTGRADGSLEAMEELAVEAGCPTCWSFDRAELAREEGQIQEAIRLFEEVRNGGFPNLPLNGSFRTQAAFQLGPLYEEVGDTARAVEAYRRMMALWANVDARGQERVREARARFVALGGRVATEGTQQ
ncbi:MAG: tetratricopeptide repeat protein [Gemmatimonadota bacterium]